ncbi:MAG: WYL domain-containing protein, partial [Elusimicrobia bacterium]|nr:WYL domain-containing protein [Elusimicrobiota bacterium]
MTEKDLLLIYFQGDTSTIMSRKKIHRPTDSQAFRILDMLDKLSSKRTFTKEELSLKYGKSIRTIERDIEDINEFKPGMVVMNKRGEGEIGPGFTLVQPELNSSQQISLIELYFVAKKMGVRVHEDFESLFKALTRSNPWEYGDEIVAAIPRSINTPPIDHAILEVIKTSIEQHVVLDIKYQTDKVPFQIKDIKPLGLIISDSNIYLQTLKGEANIRRQYRLDRIKSCDSTGS